MHEHLRPAHGGEQTHLRRSDRVALAHGDIADLDVLPRPPHVTVRGNGTAHRHLRGASVGVRRRDDGVGERRQRCSGGHAHGLAGLESPRLPGAGRDLPDHRHLHGLLVGRAHVDAAHGETVHSRLVEARQCLFGDHLLGTEQSLRLGDRHPHGTGTHR